MLPLSALFVDDRYQREIHAAWIRAKVREGFDWRLFGVLEVSRRGRRFAIFDGQHRAELARQAGVKHVPCIVHDALSPEEEAELFVALQVGRRQLTQGQRYKARLFRGEEQAVEIERMATAAGFSVNGGHQVRTNIRAIHALDSIYRRSPALLEATLSHVADWWLGDQGATSGHLIQGVAYYLEAEELCLGAEKEARLRAVPPIQIIRRALGTTYSGGGGAARAVSREVRDAAEGKAPYRRGLAEAA